MRLQEHSSHVTDQCQSSTTGSRDLSLTKGLGETPPRGYRYSPLLTSTSIRLIEWPRALTPTTDLRFRLRTIDLAASDRPPYTTLSYTWGVNSGLEAEDVETLSDLFTNTVVCDGEYLRVTNNAYIALRELQWRGRAHLFWVDAVCIDQGNLEERGQQVAMMGEIFAHAERTIVWLGEADESTRQAHAIVQLLSSTLSDRSLLPGRQYRSDDHIQALLAGHPLPFFQLQPDTNLPNELVDLLELFARPWFQRLWVIQEVVLAKQLWIICEDMTFDWQAIVNIAHDTKVNRILQNTKDDNLVERGAHGLSIVRLIAFLRGDISSFQRVVQSRFGNATGRGELYATVGTLIDLFDHSQLSDGRDRVYAPLALARRLCGAQSLATLVPNYAQSVEEVFLTAARCFIQESQSLDVLTMSKTAERTSSLPSWVPDFRVRSAQKAVSALSLCNATKGWDWKSSATARAAIDNHLHLPVTGIAISTISRTTPSITTLITECDMSTILHIVHDSAECKQEPDNLAKILLNTLTFGATGNDNPLLLLHPLSNQFSKWFSLKLLGAHYEGKFSSHDVKELFDHNINLEQSGFCSKHSAINTHRQFSSRANCVVCESRQSLSEMSDDDLKLLATGRGILSDLSFNALLRLANVIYALVLEYRAGVKTWKRLRDQWYDAYSFQTACAPYITDRSMFLTAAGSLGMCPRTSQQSDEVWFLSGARVPVILRPLRNGRYELIGETYLSGYMDGQICQEYRVERLQEIVLE